MADLSITPSSVFVDSGPAAALGLQTAGRLFENPKASTTITAGMIVTYGTIGGTVYPVANTATVNDSRLRLAVSGGATGQQIWVVKMDNVFATISLVNIGATVVNNTMYFLSATAGGICTYADLASGANIVFAGIGVGTSKLLWHPRFTGLIR